MKSKSVIFTEAFNCGKIARVALESFHKHHHREVFVFGTEKDFEELGGIKEHPNNTLVEMSNDQDLADLYKHGHEGTAKIFAMMLSAHYEFNLNQIIHFDSDIFFKNECISLIEDEFDNGFDIIGSRRCYKNNPANISVDPSLPDTISTYLFGIRRSVVPKYEFEYFRKMCKGSVNPLGHDVFDFFDPVTFVALSLGAKIKFLDPDLFGGQNEHGSKVNKFKSNLHLDMGERLCHFGGVGSGYAYCQNPENQNASYGKWALGRYALFSKLFYDGIDYNENTVIVSDRWVSGSYNDEILNIVKQELGAEVFSK